MPANIFHRLDQSEPAPYTRSEYLRRFFWLLIQHTLFRYSLPGAYRFRAFLLRCFGAKIAHPAGLRRTVTIVHPWLLELGQYSMLGDRVTVYNLGPIRIRSHTLVSQDTYLCAGTHDHTQPHLPLLRSPITIGHGVWIAAGVFVSPNVTIGDNALIAARSVVTKDVPEGMIVGGNPACVIKPRPLGPEVPGASPDNPL